MIRRDEALEYHEDERPGKIETRPTKRCLTARDMRLAALPGAAFACEAITIDPDAVFRYTARGNLVGIITNGSAVPGLGNVGPLAAKPMLEGAAVLFKRLADIDGFDLELDARDPDAFVDVVRRLAPTFGGINLKDVRAPEGLEIYARLREELQIPVLHENLQSTAVVAAAALINALALAEKTIAQCRIVVSGAGTVGVGCARLFARMGAAPGQIWLYDVNGLVHPDRPDLHPPQRELAVEGAPRTLAEGIRGADVFVGASTGEIVSSEMIRSMAPFPIVFALAAPVPEIAYDEARASRRDAIVATGLTQFPNAIVDHLSYPYVFRGALDVRATCITDGMLLAAAHALADLAREDVVDEVSRAYGYERMSFGPEYLLPKPIDPRILVRESAAVAQQAVDEGVARRPIDVPAYQDGLTVRIGTGRETLRRLMVKARQVPLRVVFADGANESIQRAATILVDEGIAAPVLLGDEAAIRRDVARCGLDPSGLTIVDPVRSPRREVYAAEYFVRRRRHGVMQATADHRLRHPEYFGAMMLASGDADMLVSGIERHYADSLSAMLEVVGPAPAVRRTSSYHLVLLPRDVYVLADCAVNIDPSAEDLAETCLLTARMVRLLGIEPRVAMLSFSNFGGVDHPLTDKVRRATEIVKAEAPGLAVDGEMQLATAVNEDMRRTHFPFSELQKNANVLIFPDLQSGNLALHLLQHVGGAVVVGPVLTGTRHPVQLLQYGGSVQDVVNLAAVGAVQAVGLRSPQ